MAPSRIAASSGHPGLSPGAILGRVPSREGLQTKALRRNLRLCMALGAATLFFLAHPLPGRDFGAEENAALPCGALPGDCASGGTVAVDELQKAVTMNLGIQPPSCGVDADANGSVSAEEVAQVAQAFLGNLSTAFGVGVTVSPSSASLPTGGTETFSAALLGCGSNTGVLWSVQEGAAGGTVTGEGNYTAPATPGIYHVVATAQADPSKSAVATVSVQGRTVLVERTVSPSSTDQTVEAEGGAVALLIPADSLGVTATVKIERVTGIPDPPAGITLKSPWYRVTVDGGAVPMAMSVQFRDIAPPSPSPPPGESAPEDIGVTAITWSPPDHGTVPSTYQSGTLATDGIYGTPTYAATWKVRPVLKTWDAKPHFTIYYYTTGDDAVPADYQAENSADPSVPDFVEDVGAFLERAYTHYTSAPPAGMGLRAPYTAEAKGQVYIGNYATSEWGKFTGYIYVANKFNSKTELGSNWTSVGGQDRTLLQWEMAHELFHAVQNRYRNIKGMGWVLWLTESLCDMAAHQVTPDSQKLMDVHLVNYGNWLNYQYWDSSSGDQTKYMGAGFFDYEAERYPAGFAINAEFMEREYSAAYSQAGALDTLLHWHVYYKVRYPEYVEYFYFDEASPLAMIYFPVTKRVPKSAYRFRNGTTGCPKPANRYAYEKDKLEVRRFVLGPAGGIQPWTADYCAVFANGDTGLPSSDKVWKYQVEMKTALNADEVAKLFLSKGGRIVGNQVMPTKGTKVPLELGRTKGADAFYVLVVNPTTSSSPATAHEVEVTPELAITNANGYDQTWPYLFCLGTPVNFQVAVVGGAPPLQFSIVDGALPPECSIDPATGLITGTLAGESSSFHNFRVQVKDSRNETATGDFSVMACRNTDTFTCTMCWYREEGARRTEAAPPQGTAAAAQMSLGGATASPGDTVQLPLSLAGAGSAPCALAADVTYDPTALAFVGAQVGAAGTAAGKSVIYSTPSPGVARVALYGLNQTPIGDGVVALLSFSVSTGATSDQTPAIACSASDCSGGALGSTCSAGTIEVRGCDLTCEASAAPSSGSPPLTVSFTATASGEECDAPAYRWDFGDGSDLSALQNPTHTYASAGTYAWTMTASVQEMRSCVRSGTVVVSGGSSCTLTCAATVPASSTAGTAVPFRAEATTANCSGSPAYAWTFGDGGASNQQNPDHTYATAGNYPWTLTVTVPGASPCTRGGTISVGGACTQPSISAHPQSQTVPNGQTATLSVTASGTAPLAYQWYRGASGSTSSPVGTNSNTFTTPALTVTTSYWVRVTNACGGADSSTATVTVEAGCVLTCSASASPASGGVPLTVAFSSAATPVNCRGESPRSEATTTLASGVPVTGSVPAFGWAMYKIVVPADATQLEVKTTATTTDLDLYVRYGAEPDSDNWDYRPYTTEGNETVTVTPSSTPRPLQGGDWYIAVYGFVDGGNFTLTATASSGGGGTTALTSGVAVSGSVQEFSWMYYSIEVPAGASQLEVKTTEASADMDLYVRFGSLPDSDNWDYRPYTLDGNETVVVTPASSPRPLQSGTWYIGVHSFWTGSYKVTATVSGGTPCALACTATAPGTGTAGSPVSFTSTATPSNCAGTPTFAWSFGDGQTSTQQNPTHAYASAGTYDWNFTVTVQGITCTRPGRITISSGSGTTFAWTFGDGQSSTQQNPNHTYPNPGTYTWTMTAYWDGKACSKTGSVTAGGAGGVPGDCDGSGTVSIGEVQKAINMFLGSIPPDCGVDCNGDGGVSIGEVQKVINAFLGVASSC